MAPRKVDFALTARHKITQFDQLVADLNELDDIYKASGYDTGGSDPITLEDLEGHDITPQDLANVSIFTANVNLFLTGGDPLEFDYASKINTFREMPNNI
jgi:hypothetical protein